MTIEQMISDWMEYLFIIRGRRAYGVSQYAKLVRRFFGWMDSRGEWDLQSLRRGDIEEWMRVLFYEHANISNQSRATSLAAIRNFLTWAASRGHRAGNPSTGIPSPVIRQKHPQIFSTEELRALFAAPNRGKIMGVRDYTVLRLLHAAGPRVSELCNLDVTSVYDSGGYIRISFRNVKGGGDRTIILKQRAAVFMRDWITVRSGILTDNPALFTTLRGGVYDRMTPKMVDDIIKKYAGQALPDGVHTFAHKMRSTFATDLYNETGDIVTVQLAMGHKKVETTMRYIAISKRHLDKLALPNSRFKEIEEG